MSDDKSRLSHEDRIIWARVARTVEAFPGKQVEADEWFAVEAPPEPPAVQKTRIAAPATAPGLEIRRSKPRPASD